MRLCDMHCHSRNSFDGTPSVEELYHAAKAGGLYAFAVTDHCECNDYEKGGFKQNIDDSCAEIAAFREKAEDGVLLLTGVEVGQPLQNPDAVEDLFARHTFDVVLWSLHNLSREEDFYYLTYQNAAEAEELLERYYTELYEMAQLDGYDVLTHLTYPLRYMIGREEIPIRRERFSEQIDCILRCLAEKGKALEINTAGLRKEIGETSPDLSIVRRFRELGGEYVTLGSDAHRLPDLGFGLKAAAELARTAGFRAYTWYRDRQPHLEKL